MSTPPDPKRPHRTDYIQAMKSMDTYIDITVDDLITLAQRAEQIANRRVTESLRIADIMSHPVRTVHPQTPVTEAAHLMISTRISGLPVVDDAGHLAGIITEADFLRALGVPSQSPSHSHSLWQTLESLFSHLAHQGELEAPDDPVADHMIHKVVCVQPDQDLHDVLEVMKQHQVKRVVVCDADQRVLGIITRSDLVRVFFDRYTQAPGKQE